MPLNQFFILLKTYLKRHKIKNKKPKLSLRSIYEKKQQAGN